MSDIFDKIHSLKGSKMCFGLERVRALLDKLGSPDEKLKIIHIAGTNGKGSIAEYLTRILVKAGKKVGTFTSPAVMAEAEQFNIAAAPIRDEKLSYYLGRALDYGGECTAFEIMTAGALLAFAEENCEYVVLECGLGGLNDATNAVKSKILAIISSIGLEHTAVLGNTIEEICAQKAGIVKDCPLIVNSLQPPEARAFFEQRHAIFGGDVAVISQEPLRFMYDGDEYESHMLGSAQPYNAATAIEAAKLLKIDRSAIRAGISEADLYGRLQVFHKGKNTYIVDGAHNPQSFGPLADMLGKFDKSQVHLVFGCLSDKDIDGNLALISEKAASVTAVEPKSPRAMSIDKIVEACKRHFARVACADSVVGALKDSYGTVVVCGSFTLVKEAINWIENVQ